MSGRAGRQMTRCSRGAGETPSSILRAPARAGDDEVLRSVAEPAREGLGIADRIRRTGVVVALVRSHPRNSAAYSFQVVVVPLFNASSSPATALERASTSTRPSHSFGKGPSSHTTSSTRLTHIRRRLHTAIFRGPRRRCDDRTGYRFVTLEITRSRPKLGLAAVQFAGSSRDPNAPNRLDQLVFRRSMRISDEKRSSRLPITSREYLMIGRLNRGHARGPRIVRRIGGRHGAPP